MTSHDKSRSSATAPLCRSKRSSPSAGLAVGRSGGTQTIPSLNPADPILKAALKRSRLTSVSRAVISTSCSSFTCSDPIDDPAGRHRSRTRGSDRRQRRRGPDGRARHAVAGRAPRVRAARHVRRSVRRDRSDRQPQRGRRAPARQPRPPAGRGEGRARAGAELAQQRKVVEAFLAASRSGDFEALLEVLDPDVVFRAESAATATRSSSTAPSGRGRRSGRSSGTSPTSARFYSRGADALQELLVSTVAERARVTGADRRGSRGSPGSRRSHPGRRGARVAAPVRSLGRDRGAPSAAMGPRSSRE